MIAYHGTDPFTAKIIFQNGFKASQSGLLGRGVYVTKNRRFAKCLGRTVIKVNVDLGNVLVNPPPEEWENWHEKGYDSVHMESTATNPNREQHCIYDPKRVTFLEIIYKKITNH